MATGDASNSLQSFKLQDGSTSPGKCDEPAEVDHVRTTITCHCSSTYSSLHCEAAMFEITGPLFHRHHCCRARHAYGMKAYRRISCAFDIKSVLRKGGANAKSGVLAYI